MKRNCKDSKIENIYEIWTNGIADENGRKRFEVNVKCMDGFKGQDKYMFTLMMLISNLRTYLEERQCSYSEILRVQKYWITDSNGANPTTKKYLLLLEDVKHLGFKEVTQQFSEGFDYEHSVLVISALARFHAASYCYRKSAR